ncbi:hypothetical protein, partial [Arthrobacter oryzae]|uniref:hypothetical protein n=1 Tax=Arthrobacter oryzae TaxID=409290 RepID=UPI001C8408DC
HHADATDTTRTRSTHPQYATSGIAGASPLNPLEAQDVRKGCPARGRSCGSIATQLAAGEGGPSQTLRNVRERPLSAKFDLQSRDFP